MYLTDYHTHSLCSPDSTAPLADMAEAAVRGGLSELCITDHYDTVEQDGAPSAPMDWTPNLEQFRRVKEQYAGRLVLKFGLEFGSGYRDGTALGTAPPELDFVIGSLHNRSGRAGGGDFFYGDYEDPAVCYEALDDYFDQLTLLAPQPVYDVLGHIIYPLRYMQPPCPIPLRLDRYRDAIRESLRAAAQSGRGMEINTYRGRTIEAWKPVLALFRAVGGEIVTVGSDAHAPGDVAKGNSAAYDLLRDAGFRYVTVYEGRKPVFVNL